MRDKYGLPNVRVYQIDGDQDVACVIAEGEQSKIKAFLEDSSWRATMEKAGVVGAPTLNIVDALTAAP